MLIAEDLLLLMYDDERGSATVESTKLDTALAGAVLLELALMEHVDVTPDEPGVKKGRLVVREPATLDDDVLAEGLELLAGKEGQKPKNVLGKLGKGLRQRLLERLADQGVLRREQKKALGIFSYSRWPEADATREKAVRSELHAAIVTGLQPTERTAALISLLVAIDAVPKAVELSDRTEKKQAKERAKEIADGEWAADAVRKAIQEAEVAIAAAATAAATAGSSGG